jgi:hypothetical protein
VTEPSKEAEKLSREVTRAAREMSRAAEEISKAAAAEAAQLTWRDYERAFKALRNAGMEFEKVVHARLGPIQVTGLPEEEAAIIADESVHRVRKELARDRADKPKAPPPTPEEIKEWEQRRDERRQRGA